MAGQSLEVDDAFVALVQAIFSLPSYRVVQYAPPGHRDPFL